MAILRATILGLFVVCVATVLAVATADAQITSPTMRFPSPVNASALPTTVLQPTTPAPNLPAVSPPPGTSLPGTTTTPLPAAPNFDPYSDPTAPVQPGTVAAPYVSDPYTPPPYVDPNYQPIHAAAPFGRYGQWAPRFLQQLRFRYSWILGSGTTNVGWHNIELSGTFLIPFLFNHNAPLLVTPGFVLHELSGPGLSFSPAVGTDLPPRLYDAFLDVAWRPQVTTGISADLGFRVGVYSDFSKVDSKSLRYLGRGFAVWRTSGTHEWRLGVVYLDRVGIKMLPSGGIIWTPQGTQGNVRWELLFPNPKLAWRLNSWRNSERWWYVAGELGGGSWSIERVATRVPPVGTNRDRFDYNDFRVMIGIESQGHYGMKWLLEGGFVFRREIDYVTNNLDFRPDETFFLRTGFTY